MIGKLASTLSLAIVIAALSNCGTANASIFINDGSTTTLSFDANHAGLFTLGAGINAGGSTPNLAEPEQWNLRSLFNGDRAGSLNTEGAATNQQWAMQNSNLSTHFGADENSDGTLNDIGNFSPGEFAFRASNATGVEKAANLSGYSSNAVQLAKDNDNAYSAVYFRIKNNTGETITDWTFSGDVFYEEQVSGGPSTIDFGYSLGNASDGARPSDFSYTPFGSAPAATSGATYASLAYSLNETVATAGVAHGDYITLRFGDVGGNNGSGIIIDDIGITAATTMAPGASSLNMPPPQIGINLESTNYYSEEYAFTDLSKNVATPFPQKNGGAWGQNDPGSVTFGANGYPSAIAADHSARTIWDLPKGHAGGQYVLLWDGTGDIGMILTPGSDIVSSDPGRIVFNLPVSPTEFERRGFDIQSTDVVDPVRNIRIVPIAEEAAFTGGEPSNPFRAVFTDRWSKMKAFRYMDWGKTNNSTSADWANRTQPNDITQASDTGVAWEHQIQHANQNQTNPWFNIPHLATDNYIENLAILIRDNLDAGLSARIEFSNEVWNGQFTQAQYAIAQAGSEGIGHAQWYSKRSVEMFDIFENVFTNNGANPEAMDRLVRVMGTQAANDWIAGQILAYNDAYLKTDALAIAPYFGAVPTAGAEAAVWTSATWAERIAMVEDILELSKGLMDDHADLLNFTTDIEGNRIYSDIKLFAYEGGQHFVGANNTHSDAALTQLMQDISGLSEMRQWYFEYLSYWDQIGGQDFMLFESLSERSKFGSWGHLEYEGQPLSESPKLQGILDYLGSINGDYDLNGTVDSADFDYWKLMFGTDDIQADGNNDGVVDAADYTIWLDGFGAGLVNSQSSSIPEPSSVVLFASIIPLLLCRRFVVAEATQ